MFKALNKVGISPQVHYQPVHLQPYWIDRYGRDELPNSESYFYKTMSSTIACRDDGNRCSVCCGEFDGSCHKKLKFVFKKTSLLGEVHRFMFSQFFDNLKTWNGGLTVKHDSKSANDGYEIFIRGETIDLVIPSARAISHDKWHSWFNDPETNRYTNYGLFPNTPQKQIDFLSSLQEPVAAG